MKLGSLVVEDVGFGTGAAETRAYCVVEERTARDFVMDGHSSDVAAAML